MQFVRFQLLDPQKSSNWPFRMLHVHCCYCSPQWAPTVAAWRSVLHHIKGVIVDTGDTDAAKYHGMRDGAHDGTTYATSTAAGIPYPREIVLPVLAMNAHTRFCILCKNARCQVLVCVFSSSMDKYSLSFRLLLLQSNEEATSFLPQGLPKVVQSPILRVLHSIYYCCLYRRRSATTMKVDANFSTKYKMYFRTIQQRRARASSSV